MSVYKKKDLKFKKILKNISRVYDRFLDRYFFFFFAGVGNFTAPLAPAKRNLRSKSQYEMNQILTY